MTCEHDDTAGLRELFAAHALTGVSQSAADQPTYDPDSGQTVEEWRAEVRKVDAEWCYAMADAMLLARGSGMMVELDDFARKALTIIQTYLPPDSGVTQDDAFGELLALIDTHPALLKIAGVKTDAGQP